MGYDVNDCWMTCGERDRRCEALGIEDPFSEIERLTAENERLRAALQQIADEEDIFNYGYTLPKIAQDALHQQETVRPDKSCQCGLTAEGRCPVCCTVPQ